MIGTGLWGHRLLEQFGGPTVHRQSGVQTMLAEAAPASARPWTMRGGLRVGTRLVLGVVGRSMCRICLAVRVARWVVSPPPAGRLEHDEDHWSRGLVGRSAPTGSIEVSGLLPCRFVGGDELGGAAPDPSGHPHGHDGRRGEVPPPRRTLHLLWPDHEAVPGSGVLHGQGVLASGAPPGVAQFQDHPAGEPMGPRTQHGEQGRILAGLIPGSRFVPLQGRNHVLLPEDPAWSRLLAEVSEFLGADHRAADDVSLTDRQREIIELVAQGRGNDEIAQRLHLSVRTVERHLSNIYARLSVNGRAARAAAAVAAQRHS
jgi:DNA-binding CsgD family transcriptional regulator